MSWISNVDTPQIAKEQPFEIQVLNMGQGRILPIDIGRLIFTYARTNLDSMALVSKNWVALADEEIFLQGLRALIPQISGVKEWKECIKVIKIVDELPIPREAYRIIEEGALLTFIPQEITVINEKGTEEIVILDNLEAIGKLFQKPITNLQNIFSSGSWEGALQQKFVQKSHWICLNTNIIGNGLSYEKHLLLAEEEDKKTYGNFSEKEVIASNHSATQKISAVTNFGKQAQENPRQMIKVSNLIDTATSILMAYTRHKRYFILDSVDRTYSVIRIHEKINNLSVSIGFYLLDNRGLSVMEVSDGENLGIACARQSFGCLTPNALDKISECYKKFLCFFDNLNYSPDPAWGDAIAK